MTETAITSLVGLKVPKPIGHSLQVRRYFIMNKNIKSCTCICLWVTLSDINNMNVFTLKIFLYKYIIKLFIRITSFFTRLNLFFFADWNGWINDNKILYISTKKALFTPWWHLKQTWLSLYICIFLYSHFRFCYPAQATISVIGTVHSFRTRSRYQNAISYKEQRKPHLINAWSTSSFLCIRISGKE